MHYQISPTLSKKKLRKKDQKTGPFSIDNVAKDIGMDIDEFKLLVTEMREDSRETRSVVKKFADDIIEVRIAQANHSGEMKIIKWILAAIGVMCFGVLGRVMYVVLIKALN